MNIPQFVPIAIFSVTLLFNSCKKQPVDQLSLLPPATQTGANTFGCLVNGKAFLPKTSGYLAGPNLTCDYSSAGQKLGLRLMATYKDDNGNYTYVVLETDSLALMEGKTYGLKIHTPGNSDAYYENLSLSQDNTYITNNTVSGSLIITKLDLSNRIVSGTFYFNGIDASNETIEVTAGRFDVSFN